MTLGAKRYSEGSGYPHPVRVAIAGGGIGGMALALALHDAGFRDVDVYESASRVKELGVGINVLPHATRDHRNRLRRRRGDDRRAHDVGDGAGAGSGIGHEHAVYGRRRHRRLRGLTGW